LEFEAEWGQVVGKRLPYWQKIGREINRRLLQVERVSQNSGLSGDSIQRVVQPTVTGDREIRVSSVTLAL
jgi:hypothetical protein